MYVYKKFLKETSKEGLDKFFDELNYYQFNNFISGIAGYGLVEDLADRLQEEKLAKLLVAYLNGLYVKKLSDDEVILNAMTMAEVIFEVRKHQIIRTMLVEHVDDFLKEPKFQDFFMHKRMLIGFKKILLGNENYKSDYTYDVLEVKKLQKNNVIIQACFFYDDEDASSSFHNSTAVYDNNAWEKIDRGNFIVFSSRLGNKMKIFMNKPHTKIGCDSAQNEMLMAIESAGYEITSYIHRGHSFYLLQSLYKMSSSGQFVFLGSCGGYNEVLKVFHLNPDVNVIATRNIGSKLINDPLLASINSDIVNNKDIKWELLWKEFNNKFQSKTTKDLFSSYIPPNKYIGIKFIRDVFDY